MRERKDRKVQTLLKCAWSTSGIQLRNRRSKDKSQTTSAFLGVVIPGGEDYQSVDEI